MNPVAISVSSSWPEVGHLVEKLHTLARKLASTVR